MEQGLGARRRDMHGVGGTVLNLHLIFIFIHALNTHEGTFYPRSLFYAVPKTSLAMHASCTIPPADWQILPERPPQIFSATHLFSQLEHDIRDLNIFSRLILTGDYEP